MQYMRAHGNTPGPTQRPRSAGAISSALASVPGALVLWISGALSSLSNVLATKVWLVLLLYLISMSVMGAVYGRIFSRAANDRRGGWLFGMSYGFLIWMLGPITALQVITQQPAATGIPAMGLLGAHLIFGVTLGLLFPFIHRLLQRRLGDSERELDVQGRYGTKKIDFVAGQSKQP